MSSNGRYYPEPDRISAHHTVMLSILFENDGTPYIWDINAKNYEPTRERLQEKINAILLQRRQRVQVWVRTRAVAQEYGISPVIWIGTSHKGPGHGAFCLGWVKVDDLLDTVEAHMGMVA